MKYMLMIYDRQDDWDKATPEEIGATMERHMQFARYMRERGTSYTGEALHQPNTATALHRGPNGEWVITDGPFPDVKEVLGGFYIFDARDLDDALEIAKRCPANVGIELRAVWDTSQPQQPT
jgi:hypothetical protein